MTISATTQGLRMGVATSSSRPAVPFDGQVISETDTDSLQVYNGTAWLGAQLGAWTSYTPVLKGGATTVSKTVTYAKYIQIGKTVILQAALSATSAGAANGTITISLPIAGLTADTSRVVGTFFIFDSGTAFYQGSAALLSTTEIYGFGYNSVDKMGTSVPAMTLASGDGVGISIMYEVA